MQNKFNYIIFLILLISSCNKTENYSKNISDEYIKSLAKGSNCMDSYIVVPIDNEEELIVINAAFKQLIYEQHYKLNYPTYYEFLKLLYKGKISNLNKHIDGYLYTDEYNLTIEEYRKNGLNFIMNKYLNKLDSNNFNFKKETNNAVIKIMFINNFYISFDDYLGKYSFSLECHNSLPYDFD